jgi:DNA-binding XRE family transcriptional regulator
VPVRADAGGDVMSTVRDSISGVTLSEPVRTPEPSAATIAPDPRPFKCPLCRTGFTDVAKLRVHAIRELRQADDAELERLIYRGAIRRFPGEGSVWHYFTASRKSRWAIGGTIVNPDGSRDTFTRRVGPNGEQWTDRAEAEEALASVWEHGLWRRPPKVPPVEQRRPLREACGLTVSAVARAVGVSCKSVRNWESGLEPKGDNARRYAVALRTGAGP